MLVAATILLLIMAILVAMISQTSAIWKNSTAKIEAFQDARAAYQTLTMRLSQATLNTYLDYYNSAMQPRTPSNSNAGTSFVPYYYARNSDLHFVIDQAATLVPAIVPTPANSQIHPGQAVFFQAPLGFTLTTASYGGMPNALNACGYYVEFNSDQNIAQHGIPTFLAGVTTVQARWRYRLMEFYQSTESLSIYSLPNAGTSAQYDQWFTNFLPTTASYQATTSLRTLHPLAENVIVFVALSLSQGAPILTNYTYDSRSGTILTATHHQLPPLLRVVMIAIDEPSARRLNPNGLTTPPAVITTALTNRFQTAANLDADITAITSQLIQAKIIYRIFDTNVAIRGAKWSSQ